MEDALELDRRLKRERVGDALCDAVKSERPVCVRRQFEPPWLQRTRAQLPSKDQVMRGKPKFPCDLPHPFPNVLVGAQFECQQIHSISACSGYDCCEEFAEHLVVG